jgi:HlyD family secretion protein
MNAEEPESESVPAKTELTESASKPEVKEGAPKPDTDTTKAKPKDGEPNSDAKKSKAKREYRNKIVFTLSIIGVLAGFLAAYIFGIERKPQPPVFKPVSSPYDSAIYANGIIESNQPSGANVNIYPEVSGPVTNVLVQEGQKVTAGTTLFTIDDSVQRATTDQLKAQSEAALALLNELKAQPRKETLAINLAQLVQATALLKAAQRQYDKRHASYTLDSKSITKDVVDTAEDAVSQATAGMEVARKQYELTNAGAWIFDIQNQEKQYEALQQSYQAANALLQKYSVKAPVAGVVLANNAALGSYVSSLGAYNAYTQGLDPLVVMGAPDDQMAVRCFVDEILVSKLPAPGHIRAQMSVRGTEIKLPLEFVRVQPYVSPKIELANQRQEKVDLRVLPVIFRFEKKNAPVYPGQMVDVFIGSK